MSFQGQRLKFGDDFDCIADEDFVSFCFSAGDASVYKGPEERIRDYEKRTSSRVPGEVNASSLKFDVGSISQSSSSISAGRVSIEANIES